MALDRPFPFPTAPGGGEATGQAMWQEALASGVPLEDDGRLKASYLLLRALTDVQTDFIQQGDESHGLFRRLLAALLELTGSEYGFIGEVLRTAEGAPYLRTYAITNIAWTDELRAFYARQVQQGLEFYNLRTLFGEVLTSGEMVVSNDPGSDPRRGGIPPGHPPLRAFLGLPFKGGGELLGMVGLANRPGGYSAEIIELLQPVLGTCSSIIHGWRSEQKRRRVEQELRQSQQQLREALSSAESEVSSRRSSEEQLRALVEALPDTLFRVRADGTFLDCKTSQVEDLLLPADLTVGRNLRATSLPQEVADKTLELIGRAIREGTLQFMEYELDMPRIGRQQYEGRIVKSGPDEAVLLVRNITERKAAEERLRQSEEELKRHRDHLEELVQSRTEKLLQATRELEERQSQLIQSEKLASVGEMAAGVAHEINNPVGYIMSNLNTLSQYVSVFKRTLQVYAELEAAMAPAAQGPVSDVLARLRLLRQQEDLDFILGDVSELLQDSLEGTSRVKEIVQNLRTFARPETGEPQPVDVNKGLETTLKMVWNELKYKCEVKCDYGRVPNVLGYPTQLNQVFMNLLLNAAQAIERRGEIRISTGAEEGEVVVRIVDTGHGMTPETLSKLFTPFFSTKPPGKGTGLGLSISYSIISRHQGRIEVQSELGQGSTFTIRLPSARE